MQKRRLFILLGAVALVLSACGVANPQFPTNNTSSASNQTSKNQTASNATNSTAATAALLGSFTSQDLDGNAVDQSILADHKLTMVNVWSTSCVYCIREMPGLAQLHTKYADQGFQIVGICEDVLDKNGNLSADSVATAKGIMDKTGASYRQLAPSLDLYQRVLQYITGTPTSFFVDSTGKQVGKAYAGYRSESDWENIIQPMLAEVTNGEQQAK